MTTGPARGVLTGAGAALVVLAAVFCVRVARSGDSDWVVGLLTVAPLLVVAAILRLVGRRGR